jgi:hypothetical protein
MSSVAEIRIGVFRARRLDRSVCSHFVLDSRIKLSYIVTCPGSRGARSRGVARCGAGTRSRDRPRKPVGGRPCVPRGCAVRLKEPCAGGRSVPHLPRSSSRTAPRATPRPQTLGPLTGPGAAPACPQLFDIHRMHRPPWTYRVIPGVRQRGNGIHSHAQRYGFPSPPLRSGREGHSPVMAGSSQPLRLVLILCPHPEEPAPAGVSKDGSGPSGTSFETQPDGCSSG